MRKALEEGSLDLIGEFTEREGESGTEDCPAYVAAARMAYGQGELVEFIIASRAAIGSGEPFKEPDTKDSSGNNRIDWHAIGPFPDFRCLRSLLPRSDD